ncbi:thioredoxin family protein [Leeuwenhoekiella aequorea]|uniref:AhpC/TSA family protein n=1 Tax=Leeuwenhoekiella aequorea TaxID=283736 RepID=A0A4Q0P3A9_9FLAO|nr:thioredoxin family protein [Leeuwenhoekiella aequorea]RXG20466.1 AhpC/TSA family protein [Leeuwenhoekiella aequorea]
MKTLKILFLLTVALVAAAAVIFGMRDYKSGYEVGDIATDFSLKNVSGNQVSLSQFNDAKGFILVFMCNTCPFSIANEERILALDKKYKSVGFPVIGINPNNPVVSPGDSFEAMQQRAKEKNFTFPYLFDEGQQVYPQYGATKTPHVFILKKENDLVVKYIGAIDNSVRDSETVTEKYVENAINSLLSDEDIKTTTTKAIGCSIKE